MSLVDRIGSFNWFPSGYICVNVYSNASFGQRQLILGDYSSGKTTFSSNLGNFTYFFKFYSTFFNLFYFIFFNFIGNSRREFFSLFSMYTISNKWFTYLVDGSYSTSPLISFNSASTTFNFCSSLCYNGFNSLLIFDNLSNHAKFHRTLMLLLKRSPGREAYPGDVFYIHSSLLEGFGQFSFKDNLGNLTSFPITETQKNIITDYITTNLISITDGSWFLSMSLKILNLFPSLDVDLSVSRLGSSSQNFYFKGICSKVKDFVNKYFILFELKKNGSSLGSNTYTFFISTSVRDTFFISKGLSYINMFYIMLVSCFTSSFSLCSSFSKFNVYFSFFTELKFSKFFFFIFWVFNTSSKLLNIDLFVLFIFNQLI